MPTGFINTIVRRATIKTILLSLAGLVIMAAIALPALNYYRNILSGPYDVAAKDLDAIDDINSLENYFLAINGDEAFDTGSATVHTYVGIELYRDKYTVISMGDRLLLVETSRDPNSLDYSGALETIPPRMQREVIDEAIRVNPELKDAFYPFMLDEGIMGSTFRLTGFIMMGIVLVVVGWCILMLKRALQWRADPSKHPIVVALGRYGDLPLIATELERELAMAHEQIGDIHITPNWVIYRTTSALEAVRFDDMMWIYATIFKKSCMITVWDRHGKHTVLTSHKKQYQTVMETLLRRVPWVVSGYDFGILDDWNKKRNEFIAGVERRRQESGGNA